MDYGMVTVTLVDEYLEKNNQLDFEYVDSGTRVRLIYIVRDAVMIELPSGKRGWVTKKDIKEYK